VPYSQRAINTQDILRNKLNFLHRLMHEEGSVYHDDVNVVSFYIYYSVMVVENLRDLANRVDRLICLGTMEREELRSLMISLSEHDLVCVLR
jgi:hypothetical protein